jgi:hypothetical protein
MENSNHEDAAQTLGEAGATPPFDAPCVTGLRGVTPASLFLKGLNFDFDYFNSEGLFKYGRLVVAADSK